MIQAPLFDASPDELSKAKAQIFKICRQSGSVGASKTVMDAYRGKIGLSAEERNRLLASLVSRGELVEVRDRMIGRSAVKTRYVLPEYMKEIEEE